MSFRKLNLTFAALVCSTWLLAFGVQAEEASGAASSFAPRSFEALLRKEEIVGWEQARRIYIKCGTNEFVFALPQSALMETSSPVRIVLGNADATYFLTFRILSANPGDTAPESSDLCRDLILKQYPGARNLQESPATSAGRHGRGFEMLWKPAGTSERLVRMAFIPSAAGMIEFTLVADPVKNTEATYAYKYLLASCLSNELGKIKIVPQLDRS